MLNWASLHSLHHGYFLVWLPWASAALVPLKTPFFLDFDLILLHEN